MAVDVGGEADVEAASVITACIEARGWINVMFSSSESDVSMDITVAEIKANNLGFIVSDLVYIVKVSKS